MAVDEQSAASVFNPGRPQVASKPAVDANALTFLASLRGEARSNTAGPGRHGFPDARVVAADPRSTCQ